MVALSREIAELEPVVEAVKAWRAATASLAEARAIMADAGADADSGRSPPRRRGRPPTPWSGTTGADAGAPAEGRRRRARGYPGGDGRHGWRRGALFAGDLFRMYARFAQAKGWRVETLSESPERPAASRRSSRR